MLRGMSEKVPVYLDANAVISATWLPELVLTARQLGMRCVISDIVLDECSNHRRQSCTDAQERYRAAHKKIEQVNGQLRHLVPLPSIDALVNEYTSKLRNTFDVVETTGEVAREALR